MIIPLNIQIMKKRQLLLLTLVLGLFALNGHSQNIGINEDGATPNPNAILDIKSFTKGLLIPRVSTTGRLAIPNTKGMLVYDTTAGSFWYNTGSAWQNMAATGGGWSLTGNGGTGVNNFLGTTDNRPLVIQVNNLPAGRIEPDSTNNTFLGYRSGSFNNPDRGHFNTATGSYSLFSNTNGSDNTASGYRALADNTNGSDNTATGYQVLKSNISGNNNSAFGDDAMFYNTTGSYNTSVGGAALLSNTTGNFNTATGFFALGSSKVATNNTATGYRSMVLNVLGIDNTATGSNSLGSNFAGEGNTATGAMALFANNGNSNTADGDGSLSANTVGFFNTALGRNSLQTNTTGSGNTAIGFQADVSAGNLSNATALGNGAIVNGSNKVRIGNSAVTVIEGQVPFTTPSDGRYKFNIEENIKGLDFILKLRPVTYQFDTKRFDAQLNHPASQDNSRPDASASYAIQTAYDEATRIRRSGFIAQEVEQAANASGYDFSGIIKPRTEQDHYSLSYESFVVPLVKGMQEQQKIILEQQKKLTDLQQQLDELKQWIQQRSK
jgi:hypothetical protein